MVLYVEKHGKLSLIYHQISTFTCLPVSLFCFTIQHLKDPEVMKSHLAVVQTAVCSESSNSNLDDAICRMLEKIFEATM